MVAVQCGLRGWNHAKSAASEVDPMFTGIALTGLILVGGAFTGIEYGRKMRTAKQKVRYGTEIWEHTSRECAVCKDVFPTIRLQTTKQRHHCFSCGHFVCNQCSTTEMYLDVTGKVRRVCDECVTACNYIILCKLLSNNYLILTILCKWLPYRCPKEIR